MNEDTIAKQVGAKDEVYLVCTNYGQQTNKIAFVKTSCHFCNQELAMDAMNKDRIEREGAKTICIACMLKQQQVDIRGALIGGQLYRSVESAAEATKKLVDDYEKKN